MSTSIYNSHAIVALPAVRGGAVRTAGLRAWLARGDVESSDQPAGMLDRVMAALGRPPVADGQGALRLWGQTGDRPTIWMAAADPVYLEPRLDHLCLHRLSTAELPSQDVGRMFDELQAEFGAADELGFVQIGRYGYLRGTTPIETARLSAEALDGREPSPWMPTGPAAASFHRLHSEIQMALHLSETHRDRETRGLRAVNALWIWGGGAAPPLEPRPIPPLFAMDSLLRGYWHSAAGVVADWNGCVTDCTEQAPDGFVAALPPAQRRPDGSLDGLLAELRNLLRRGPIRTLTLLFSDGVSIRLRRRHAWRVWRRRALSLEPDPGR